MGLVSATVCPIAKASLRCSEVIRGLMENPGPFVLEFEDGKLMEFVVTQYDPVADLC